MSFNNPLPVGIRQVVPDYVSDGVTLTFGFPWRLFAAADLAVLVSTDGLTWSTLALGAGYAITINSNTSATVTLMAAEPAGALVRLMGLRTPSRLTSVVNDGIVQSGPLETELDCVEATMQELRRDVTNAEQLYTSLLALINAGLPSNTSVTLRQVWSWAAAQGQLYAIENAVPANIANATTIQWRRGATMLLGDGLYQFIAATLGLSGTQMALAFQQMQGYSP